MNTASKLLTLDGYLKLVAEIRHHSNLYYNQATPEISDYEFDELMMRLRAVEAEHPE